MILSSPNYITIQNTNIYYELFETKYGSKNNPTFVLIHGSLSSTFSFRKLTPFLQEEFTTLALDLPPFGRSDKSVKIRFTYDNLAEIVLEVIQLFKIQNCILIGHSMGGQISLIAAKKAPHLVKNLVLICSSGYMPRFKPLFTYATYIPFFSMILRRKLTKQGVKTNLLNVVHNLDLIDDEMIHGYEQPFRDKKIFYSLSKLIRHREGDLTSEQLQSILTPTLLIWGREDKVVPLHIGEKLHQDLPHSTLIVYKQTGHLVPEERPKEVYLDIKKFLNFS